jgi:hypothetical protein
MSQLRQGCSFVPEQLKLSRLASNSFIEHYGEAGWLLYGEWQYSKVVYLLQVFLLGAHLSRHQGAAVT